MSASDQDEIEDMSDDQIIAVRRGEPVSVTGYVTSLDDESDGALPLLVRKNECANPLIIQGTLRYGFYSL